MSNIHQSSNRSLSRHFSALFPILLLAPLAMAPKGCDQAVIGNDCPPGYACTAGNSGIAGGPSAGSGNDAGAPGAGVGNAPNAGGNSGGSVCGGLRGLSCAKDEYCAFPQSAQCGAADQTGTCTPRPEMCTLIYGPVCGCDGKSYPNDCEAARSGTSVAKGGPCETPPGKACGGEQGFNCAKGEFCDFPIEAQCGAMKQMGTCEPTTGILCPAIYDPVCGCDGHTYGNECEAQTKGTSVASKGACEPTTSQCGGLQGLTCADGEFCNFPIGSQCGAADQTGTCLPMTNIGCLAVYDPVCGCDGKTYGNDCEAQRNGVSVASKGECAPSAASCGGLTGAKCLKDEFCDFPKQCGNSDETGTCRVPPQICDAIAAPVCGCDGKTYGNACNAASAGVSVASKGACTVR